MGVIVTNMIISCIIAQPNGKGVYPTHMKALGHNEKYFVVDSGQMFEKDGEMYQEVVAIEKSKCKVIFKEK